MDYLIQKYLEQNGLTGTNGIDYTLQDDGAGAYIKTWNLPIEEPSFTESDFSNFSLDQAKATKISQLKANRDIAKEVVTPNSGSIQYEIEGIFRIFKLKVSDLATLNGRIDRISRQIEGTTAQWTDANGNTLNLTLSQFQELADHLDIRDQAIYEFYNETKKEIQACETLEELNTININFP